jgi:nucleotide-binding universal stress UspA family protein
MDSRDYGVLRAFMPQTPQSQGAFKSIAVGTDFSATSMAAVRRAAQLSRANGARLHLIHILSPASAKARALLNALGAHSRLSASAAVSYLRHAEARVVTEFDIPVDTHLGVGHAPREIASYARALRADLIVLGNFRRRLVAQLLGTSTALRVRAKTKVPVLAVSSPELRAYARILFASDLSPEAARAAQQSLRYFRDAKLVVLHAFESPHTGMLAVANDPLAAAQDHRRRAELEGMERLRAFARQALLGEDSVLRVDLGHPALAARRQAREDDVDLVLLQPSKHWRKSGVAQQLIADPPCDLLLMP